MLKNEFLHIGTFLQPVGLKGEIKIKMNTVNSNSFKKLKPFYAEDFTIFNFESIKYTNGKLIGKLKNYNSRNDIEIFRGKKIYTKKSKLPKIKKNEYYVVDLIKCEVLLEDKNLIGFVVDVNNFGAGDLLNIKPIKGKNFYIPLNEENIISININKKVIFVKPIKGILS